MSVTATSWVWKRSWSVGNDRLVLLAIADDADGNGENAWPTVATISEDTLLDERTVTRCIVALEHLGELHVELNAGGSEELRRRRPDLCPNRYTILLADRDDRPEGARPTPRRRVTSRRELDRLRVESGVSDCHPDAGSANDTRVLPEVTRTDDVDVRSGVSDCHPVVIHRGDSSVTPIEPNGVTAGAPRGDSRCTNGVTAGAPRGDRAVSPRTREELELEQERTTSAPPAGAASTGQHTGCSRDEIRAVLRGVFGPASTPSRKRFYQQTATELLAIEPVPSRDEIHQRATRCVARYPDASPAALVKHWDALADDRVLATVGGDPWGLIAADVAWHCTVGDPDCVNGLIETVAGELTSGAARRCPCIAGEGT